MVVQQQQVQPQVQPVQPQVQPQAAVPTAQASQIVGSGVQVRASGVTGCCLSTCAQSQTVDTTYTGGPAWVTGSLGTSPWCPQWGDLTLVTSESPHLSSDPSSSLSLFL